MQRHDARAVALELLVRRHQPAWDAIRVDRELSVGDDAVFAVAFDDLGAKPQRALLGLRRDAQGDWRSSGGSWGSPQPARETELWTVWGGWGLGGEELSSRAGVIAGWVADPDAIVARLTGGSGRSTTRSRTAWLSSFGLVTSKNWTRELSSSTRRTKSSAAGGCSGLARLEDVGGCPLPSMRSGSGCRSGGTVYFDRCGYEAAFRQGRARGCLRVVINCVRRPHGSWGHR